MARKKSSRKKSKKRKSTRKSKKKNTNWLTEPVFFVEHQLKFRKDHPNAEPLIGIFLVTTYIYVQFFM